MASLAQQLANKAKIRAEEKEGTTYWVNLIYQITISAIKSNKCHWSSDYKTVDVGIGLTLPDHVVEDQSMYYTLNEVCKHGLKLMFEDVGFQICHLKLINNKLINLDLCVMDLDQSE